MKITALSILFALSIITSKTLQAQDSISYHIEYTVTGQVQNEFDSLVEVSLVIEETDLEQIEQAEFTYNKSGEIKKITTCDKEKLKLKPKYKVEKEISDTVVKQYLRIIIDTLPLSEACQPGVKLTKTK